MPHSSGFCRRAGIEVLTVSVTGKRQIMGAHQICFHADEVYNDMNFEEFDGIVYPGGRVPAYLVKTGCQRTGAEVFKQRKNAGSDLCGTGHDF